MTNNIYPPDHLLRKWESLIIDEEQNVDVVLYEAFQAGADQELEACCEWLKAKEWIHPEFSDELRAARRPKPPSLKEQALESLHHLEAGCAPNVDLLRRALEQLDD
jgi:hypothetical protein